MSATQETSPTSHHELLAFYKSLALDNKNPNVNIASACPAERIPEIVPLLYFFDDVQSNFERMNKPRSDLVSDKLLENSEFRFAREILNKRFDIDLKASTFLTYFDGVEWLSVKNDWRDNFPAAIKFTYLDKFGNQKTITLGNRSSDAVLDYDISFFKLPTPNLDRESNTNNPPTSLDNNEVKVEHMNIEEAAQYIGRHVSFLSISGKEIVGMAFTKGGRGVLQLCGTADDRMNAHFNSPLNFIDSELLTNTRSELIRHLISDSVGGSQSNHQRVNALNQLLSDRESALGSLGERIGKSQKSLQFFMASGVSDIFLMGQVAVEPGHNKINRASKINMIRFRLEDRSKTNYLGNVLNELLSHTSLQSFVLELANQFGENFIKIHPELLLQISSMIPTNTTYNAEANITLTRSELKALNMPKTPSRPRPLFPSLQDFSMITS